MKALFTVELEVPPRSSADFVASYIQHVVKSMKGSLRPEDPLFDLDRNSVKVSIAKVFT